MGKVLKIRKLKNIVAIILAGAFALSSAGFEAEACTSALALAKATKNGRPMLWKNRDTGTEHNFVARVPAKDGNFEYVALYNGGDSLLLEAWAGFNAEGFAIMNTASYNLAPDTAKYKDREAEVMTAALKKCRTVGDFEKLLKEYKKPMGVQANFGVIDAFGNGAYFETDDYGYTKFDAADVSDGVLIRTNFSESGNAEGGYGYIRCDNARHLLGEDIKNHSLTPASFTEGASRSFYHSLLGKDFTNSEDAWIIDQDFIPRKSTSATVVLEGVKPGEDPSNTMMWIAIGYPPVSYVLPVFIDDVPEELQPLEPGFRSKLCNETLERKHRAFPITNGSGPHYIDMNYLREVNENMHALSLENYKKGELKRAMRLGLQKAKEKRPAQAKPAKK